MKVIEALQFDRSSTVLLFDGLAVVGTIPPAQNKFAMREEIEHRAKCIGADQLIVETSDYGAYELNFI